MQRFVLCSTPILNIIVPGRYQSQVSRGPEECFGFAHLTVVHDHKADLKVEEWSDLIGREAPIFGRHIYANRAKWLVDSRVARKTDSGEHAIA